MSLLAGMAAAGALLGLIAVGPYVGGENAACGPDEAGPALKVDVVGLKDRRGTLRVELYPPNDADFLADDFRLLEAGKSFRRLMIPTPTDTGVQLCIRAPRPGRYAVAVLQDRRGGKLKFSPWTDGAGFPGNPRLGTSKPKASAASIEIGSGVTTTAITMNYWDGAFGFGPVRRR